MNGIYPMKFFDSLKAKFNRVSDKIYYACSNTANLSDAEKLDAEMRRRNPNIRRVLQLHDKGVVTTNHENTPLELAAIYGHSAVVTALLDHGVDVNQRSQHKDGHGALIPKFSTAFSIAILNRHPKTAKIFAQRGATFDLTDGAGNKNAYAKECQEILAWESFAEVAEILNPSGNNLVAAKRLTQEMTKKNPDIRRILQWSDQVVKTYDGYTPLTYAVNYGRPEIVTALLDHGVDVNQRDTKGRTALFYAVHSEPRHPGMAKVLAQRGALADFTCNGEEDILTRYAQQYLAKDKFKEVAAILKARGNNQATPKPPAM
ncbi:MAG: ankyrin repeat domain-containing protein [Alphaproteobacteria bacterium]|nr:ankyrin repeat domain-containing protein [Alphaproteobacteria bacterium]